MLDLFAVWSSASTRSAPRDRPGCVLLGESYPLQALVGPALPPWHGTGSLPDTDSARWIISHSARSGTCENSRVSAYRCSRIHGSQGCTCSRRWHHMYRGHCSCAGTTLSRRRRHAILYRTHKYFLCRCRGFRTLWDTGMLQSRTVSGCFPLSTTELCLRMSQASPPHLSKQWHLRLLQTPWPEHALGHTSANPTSQTNQNIHCLGYLGRIAPPRNLPNRSTAQARHTCPAHGAHCNLESRWLEYHESARSQRLEREKQYA